MLRRLAVQIRKSELDGFSGFTIVLVPTVLLLATILFIGVSVDQAIGISGGILAIATFSVAQYQSHRPRTRHVVFLAKSRSPFARNIFRGLTDGLEQYGDIHVSGVFPDGDSDGSSFQLKWLKSLEAARAHAIVVIPATEDHDVWQDLARIMDNGTVVVCVDTKPPNHEFRQQGITPPLFVGSDFALGGRMLGRYLERQLKDLPETRLIMALGPEPSWPGRERTSRILYELGVAGLLARCETVELEDWTAPSCVNKMIKVIEAVAVAGCHELFVFAGNDKLALELDRQLDRHLGKLSTVNVRLIGYDGTTNDDGSHLLEDRDRTIATVDAVPFDQGLAAAEFIAWAYEGRVPHLTKMIVRPRLLEFGKRVSLLP